MSEPILTQPDTENKVQIFNSGAILNDYSQCVNALKTIKIVFKNLIEKPVWIASEKESGKPVNVRTGALAESNNPDTWATFAEVESFIKTRPGHLPALSLSGAAGVAVVDLDGKYETKIFDVSGMLTTEAEKIVKGLNSYTEISKSGKGIHVFVFAEKPAGIGSKKGDWLEVYDSNQNKFMTVTGNYYGEPKDLESRQTEFEAICLEYLQDKVEHKTYNVTPSPQMSDDEIIALCRKDEDAAEFESLYDRGDMSKFGVDASSAEWRLLSLLAYYTQNPEQLERLLRSSKLFETAKPIRVQKGKDPNKLDNHKTYLSKTIQNVIEKLPDVYQPKDNTEKPTLKTLGLSEFLTKPIPERPLILPWCREQNICMLYAWRGIGKTLVALNIAYAIASGGEFLGWPVTTPKKVLYIDGEMPGIALQERLANIVKRNKGKHPPGDEYFQLLASDMQDTGLPYLDTPEGQALIQPFVDKADVIIVDNLSTLTCQPENEAQAWIPMQQWVLAQRRAGKTIIFIHHAGKGGAQRGSSKREDILDVVINLKRPPGYMPEQGARFELHFEKTRGIHGKQVVPLDIRVEERNGVLHWIHSELESAILDKIKELKTIGMKDHDIWTELKISKASYYRHKQKLAQSGEQGVS